MRNFIVTMIGALLITLLAACAGNKVDDVTTDRYITLSENVISLLNENKYEEVHSMFSENLKEVLPLTGLEELAPVIEESGDFKQIDKSSVEEKDSLYITVLVAKYSDKKRVYTINYNENEEVEGLFIK